MRRVVVHYMVIIYHDCAYKVEYMARLHSENKIISIVFSSCFAALG